MLILCGSVVYTARRFMFGLALLFVFLLFFWRFDHFAWGAGAGLCAGHASVCLLCARWSVSLFLFLLVSGVGCGFCLWLFLDFSVYRFEDRIFLTFICIIKL